ncbi:hypothetical protein SEA_JACOREN57_35 [Mycobacterium phage JacoRen57]|nr:hypothetical protein SEA_JACOREN57_35 [Mycobacterium phage JacoRen57]
MGKKKELKKELKHQERIADDLFRQMQDRSHELARVDELLLNAQLPGPTIEAWAQQVRDLFRELVRLRGLQPLGANIAAIAGAQPQVISPIQGPPEAEDNGTYSFLSDADLSEYARQPRGFA